jgi:hypothetical protein
MAIFQMILFGKSAGMVKGIILGRAQEHSKLSTLSILDATLLDKKNLNQRATYSFKLLHCHLQLKFSVKF